jgi:hypothetical protein
MNKKTVWIVVAIVVVALVVWWMNASAAGKKVTAPLDVVMCTQDVGICADGSYVTRTGPSCEFAKCADGSDPISPEPVEAN